MVRTSSSGRTFIMSLMHRILTAVAVVAASAGPALAATPKVVTTTEDLAALVREVGGDKVSVDAIARGYQDPHFVDPKPSFILKLHDADLLVMIGRELEIGWLPPLLTQSRNARIQPGSPGYVDASSGVRILELPTGQITRAMGDVHPQGNPHYWLDPDNGRIIAKSLVAALGRLSPADQGYFEQRYADFDKRLAEAQARWTAALAPYKGTKIVTYHRSWPNFAERFGLDVIGYVEPKPGIPPSPSHTVELIAEMKRQQAKIILVEPYFDTKTPDSVAREVGGKVLVLSPSVGGVKEASDYIKLFDYNIGQLTATFKQVLGR
jgi:zinc/manganese transport system substrate-binding protein